MAEFACCALPAFYMYGLPVTPSGAERRHRVLFAPNVEVDIDGLWLLDDAE
ncbi:hypothetical protein M8542_38515 [Amycolatopsis sp. OK19-0408]|uniref:Uncharacterized protein n=1 Tax=Amycolatopsis iheyensis TaxID=2945988 RepID=A0A9X2SQK1_9PSEU|nr:hypothetical protein [Amycolatopsis iheyensis]MCR6488740.1 hypothetical protein [Amycolatopsis iheyensis]